LSNLYGPHPSMKNSASMFRAPDALECTSLPVHPTGCKNKGLAQSVLKRFLKKSVLVPPKLEKYCFDDSLLGCTEMHCITCRSHRIQK
jgi:hypothetical protein